MFNAVSVRKDTELLDIELLCADSEPYGRPEIIKRALHGLFLMALLVCWSRPPEFFIGESRPDTLSRLPEFDSDFILRISACAEVY